MIRVLIAEDSATVRELLRAIVGGDGGMTVVGEAGNGVEAVELTKALRPDLVVMDIAMPEMDGFEATRRIMVETPTPIVIVSARYDVHDVQVSMHALHVGALTAVPKPRGPQSAQFEDDAREFLAILRLMSQVKVVRRWRHRRSSGVPVVTRADIRPRVVAMAASTGGPAAIHQILADLPADFPVAILLVQHMSHGFMDGFAAWLDTAGPLRVQVASEGQPLEPATVYVAPDDLHLGIAQRSRIALAGAPAIHGFRPSANHLFASVADQFGRSAVGVILTGMGDDGCVGLAALRREGGRIVVQDEKTSVVFGMPGAAVEAGLADWTLPLPDIAPTLRALVTTGGP
jgi:two-component system, chemotaxis family, protein-glutamate methylesterase/glutaminase